MKRFLKFLSIFGIVFSAMTCVASITAISFLARYKDSHVDADLLKISRSSGETVFYGYRETTNETQIQEPVLIEGATLSGGRKYKYIPYSKIPSALINAFIAIEDKRFFDHNGIDLLRTAKATANYFLGGKKSFGGSTITQQLVKNLTGNDQISPERKITEAFSALDIEKNYDKTEILEMYLNVINLSNGCCGIGAGAEYYYSKEPSELTISECATIAAITNNPSKYDPKNNPQNNKKRRDLILKCMLEENFISQKEFDEAMSSPIALKLNDNYKANVNSWYIDMVTSDVIEDLSIKYGISRNNAAMMLYRGGYKIYTAMDISLQNILDDYYSEQLKIDLDKEGKSPQSSMIIISPSGEILAVVGAVGEKTGNRIQNYATDTKRPPGSTIKPLSVYAPALNSGIINWSTVIEDSPVKNNPPWPSNVTKRYSGNVTIKYAIENSLNTVAVKVLDMIGAEKSFDFLNDQLYFKSLDREADIGQASLALGQPSHGVTLREIVAAYTVFQNGNMSKPRSYYKVTDSSGKIILDNTPKEKQVISPETAAIMTKLLETVVDTGTARTLISLDSKIDIAGKTGTTQNNCDKYFIGYTPSLVAGVWFGYDYPKSLSEYGSNLSAKIWDNVMSKIYKETGYKDSPAHFSVPDSVQKLTYDKFTGEVPPTTSNTDSYEEGWFTIK